MKIIVGNRRLHLRPHCLGSASCRRADTWTSHSRISRCHNRWGDSHERIASTCGRGSLNMTAPTAVRGKFAVDSPLEGDGFEPSVSRVMDGDLGTAGTSADRGFSSKFNPASDRSCRLVSSVRPVWREPQKPQALRGDAGALAQRPQLCPRDGDRDFGVPRGQLDAAIVAEAVTDAPSPCRPGIQKSSEEIYSVLRSEIIEDRRTECPRQ